jgi:hypothetical protein
MEDSVCINGKGLPVAGLLAILPPDAIPAQRCKAGQETLLFCIKLLSNIQQLGTIVLVRVHSISLKQ